MSWRVTVGVAIVTVLSLAAAAVAILSVGNPSGAERVKEAIRWPPSCANVTIRRPASEPIMNTWSAFTSDTADLVCGAAGPRVAYANFKNEPSLNQAVAAHQPSQRYCVLGTSLVIDRLTGVDPTIFTDMCLTLQGTFVNSGR